MFARNVSIHLKPNSSVAFIKQIENETVPTLRKQEGFQGELTFLAPGGMEAVAISLWDKKGECRHLRQDWLSRSSERPE